MRLDLDDTQRGLLEEVLAAAPLQGHHAALVLRTRLALRGHDPRELIAQVEALLGSEGPGAQAPARASRPRKGKAAAAAPAKSASHAQP